MRWLGCAFVVQFAAACASSGPAVGAAPPPQTVRVTSTSISSVSSTTANIGSLPYSMDRIWAELPAVFDVLGIPLNTLDVPNRTIGNNGFKVRRRLKDVPLSRYIECGSMQGEPSADTYEVYLSVITRLDPEGKGATTTVTTTVDAQARPVALAGQYTSCASKGNLEQTILDRVRMRLR